MARELGYRSRAAFKLLEINKRYRLMKKGDVVVDLGAAPGGWMQVAGQVVGETGLVLGVDVLPIRRFPKYNLLSIKADLLDPNTPDLILSHLPRKADVVLSDASPRISGVWDVDHLKSVELCQAALKICKRVLREGGCALLKIFQGEKFLEFKREFDQHFEFSKATKPKASRKGSAEIYLIGRGFMP